MIGVLGQAALPTARTIRWWPLGAVAAPVLGLVLVARSQDRPATGILLIGAAALASLAVAGLRDDAAALLEPVPVPPMSRRLLRLALAGVPTLLSWWALMTVAATGGEPGTGPLLSLAACGVAVAVWGPARWRVLAATAVPVVWFTLDSAVGPSGALGDALAWWRTDPWVVLALAVAVCVLGRRR
jgi:hypothetical protein